VKKILLREANAEGHRCVKKETAAFCQSRHTTVIHNTLSTKEEEEKKNTASKEKGGLFCVQQKQQAWRADGNSRDALIFHVTTSK